MNDENTKKLFETFPELYWSSEEPLSQSAMWFGFECGDGWFGLIWELSEKLSPLAKEFNKEHGERAFKVVQVKEKFGGLRYYVGTATDEIFKIIHEYEERSYEICEVCGKPGKSISYKGWIRTECEEHDARKRAKE